MILKNLLVNDFETVLKSWWSDISPVSKKAFLWTFLTINFIFLWHTLTFIPDNHSLGLLKSGIPLTFQYTTHMGRFAGGILQQLVGGNIFPIFNNVICYGFFSLALIYLANYWSVPKTAVCYTLFSLMIALMPYTLPWVYFIRHQTYFVDIFLMIWALTLLLNPNIFKILLSSLIFLMCLGTYPAMIQFIGIALLGRCLADRIYKRCSCKDLYKKYKSTLISICLSIGFFLIIETLLYINGQIDRIPQTSFEFPRLQKIKQVFTLYITPIPYISQWLKILLILPFLGILLSTVFKKDFLAFLLVFGIFCIANLINLCSPFPNMYITRIQFWNAPWFYACFAIMALRYTPITKNIIMFIMCIIIYHSSIQDMKWQKIYFFESTQEIAYWINIIHEIHNHPNFDATHKYNIHLIGIPSYRRSFTPDSTWHDVHFFIWNHYIDGYFSQIHIKEIFDFFEPKSYVNNIKHTQHISTAHIPFKFCILLQSVADTNSQNKLVYLTDSDIYIVSNNQTLKAIQNRICSQQ